MKALRCLNNVDGNGVGSGTRVAVGELLHTDRPTTGQQHYLAYPAAAEHRLRERHGRTVDNRLFRLLGLGTVTEGGSGYLAVTLDD